MPAGCAGKLIAILNTLCCLDYDVEGACTQDIDDILRNRTEKRQLGNGKGNTFSTATFTIEEEPQVSNHSESCYLPVIRLSPLPCESLKGALVILSCCQTSRHCVDSGC